MADTPDSQATLVRANGMVTDAKAADAMSTHVADIENRLAVLDAAFASGESPAVENACQALQRSLADSLVAFRRAGQTGLDPLSAELRARLKLAQARIQAQQVAVLRANASIDRTLRVLFPREESSTYGAMGATPGARALNNAYR